MIFGLTVEQYVLWCLLVASFGVVLRVALDVVDAAIRDWRKARAAADAVDEEEEERKP